MDPFALNLIMIICYVVGSGLVILEAFIPGFGVAGVSGAVLEMAALWATWRLHGVGAALIGLAAVLVLIGLAVFLSYRSAMKGRLSKSPLVLKDTEEPVENNPSAGSNPWIGREGTVVTPLRPAGFIEIDGQRLNASSAGDFLEKGRAVRVIGTESDHLLIKPVE